MLTTEILVDTGGSDRRESGRQGLEVWARAHYFERRPLTINIRDLSCQGCMIDASEHVSVGTEIYVQLPGLPLMPARVVWVNEQNAGCEFFTPLSGSELDIIRASDWRR